MLDAHDFTFTPFPDLIMPDKEQTPVEDEKIVQAAIELVCIYYRVTEEDIMSRSRQEVLATPRHTIAWIISKITKLSSPQIGRLMDGRDHTTILNSIKAVNDWIERDDRRGRAARHLADVLR